MALAPVEGVVAGPAGQTAEVAGPAGDGVVAGPAVDEAAVESGGRDVEGVVAGAAGQHDLFHLADGGAVGEGAGAGGAVVDRQVGGVGRVVEVGAVVAGPADHGVDAPAGQEIVVALAPVEGVVAAAAVENIIATKAIKRVGIIGRNAPCHARRHQTGGNRIVT